ncbi:DNA-dependent protein kinase catalytic subunit-like [Anopheles maculipalpis]|uniref:DNA-dependent protein kinase catalytic subunit-like n=1 Tax=Anopheles maculipalpis TaxID=1496333 RepID=UPI002158ED9D|nr:DNA-dependent protein kinase catalytic subunit-like [Anopheles maculipalpis]
MASDLGTCLRQLKTCLDTQQIPQARSVIDRITQLIIDKADESATETDFKLECLFTSPNGLVPFLEKSFANAKHFAKVIEDAFELLRKTIEKHSPLLGKRMPIVVPIAIRCIKSSSVSARPRELATLVLQDSIAYGCLHNDSYEKLNQLPGEILLVFQQGKLPNRLQQNLYELMGQLAKHFPDSVIAPERMRDILVNAVEKQLLEENYPSLVSLAGAIRGLDMFLFHFAPSECDRELRQRLYLMIKKLSIWDESRSERVVFRNALQLVANHAALFSVQMYLDHVHWQTMLAGKWIKSTSQDDRQIGLNALYAFHAEIARVLSNPEIIVASERECPSTVDVLNQYVGYYRKLLNSPSADQWEIRIAIRGFGIMAGPCQQITGSSVSLNELLTIVLQRIEGICERTASSSGDALAFLPDFIQALSEILTHAKQLTTIQLVSVQTMTVALVRDFYHLPTVHHELIVRSLVCMLENVGKLGGSSRDQLLDSILLQGIVWSCSHALPFGSSPPVPSSTAAADDPAQKTDWKRDLVTYKNYLPLWQGLLNKAQTVPDSSLLRAIYRALMNTLFVIVEKLDLSTRKRTFQDDDGQERELFFCDPNIDLIPIKPKDYHIFLNLVELNRDVLHSPQTPTALRELFIDWIRPYFERFVKQSLECPLVSGFVKLIEMGLGTAETIGYFHQREGSSDDPDVRSIQMLLVYYVEQTVQRAIHATGELQLACLRFVLKAPVRLLFDFVQDEDRKQPLMVEVFRTAFHIGRGLLSIAREALYSLQRIIQFRYPPLRGMLRERLLRQVLPMLEPFLRTRDSTQPPAQSLRLAKFKRHRTANVAAGRIERIKQQHRIERTADMSELVTLQMRILKFLSNLQPNECCWLVVDELEQTTGTPPALGEFDRSSLTRWDADSGRSLELRLLCENGTRPCIKLDGVVGRVCQLAVECSDRATKLAACELLHTTVLYLLGIGYQDQLAGLWSQICHHLLHLSCDTDLAVCQMFEPLLFQIIHFVTQPSKLTQQGTRALLDCLMDATSNVRHSAVRDLSIRCLREFLQWTNRQCGGTQSAKDRRKIKNTLLEQLKTHALESNASHRYGSALAFNNLFRLLLQEDYQIVRYTFELMHSYSLGLMVTEEQNGCASEGAHDAIAEQFLLALEHLGSKVLEVRNALFNCSGNRPEQCQLVPAAIGGGEMKHIVSWLFRQCATRQPLHRRKCMQLFVRLSKTVRDVASGEQFLKEHYTYDQIKGICLQADSPQGIGQSPTLMCLWDEHTNPSVINIYLWLEYLLATLDMYCWLQREKLVAEELAHMLLSRILPAVQCFLRSVIDFSVYEIMSNINRNQAREIQMTSYDRRMNADKIVWFDALKSAVVVQIVDLFVLLLSRTSSSEDQTSDESLELWQQQPTIDFLLALLFKPHQLGMDRNVSMLQEERKNVAQLVAQLEELIRKLMERYDHPIGKLFSVALSEKLVSVMEDLGDRMKTLLTLRTIHLADQKSAKGLLFIAKQHRTRFGYAQLTNNGKDRIQQAGRRLLANCYEAIGQEGVCLVLSPSAARFGTIVLEAVFLLSGAMENDNPKKGLVDTLISYSLSKEILHPNIRHGEHFLICFGSAVYELFIMIPAKCLDTLLQELTVDNFPFIIRILCDLMDYSYRSQAANKDRLESLLQTLLTKGWPQLFACSRLQPNLFGACDVQMIELMASKAMICPFPLHEIRQKVGPDYERWLAELIGSSRSEVSIELKTKAIVLLPTVLGPRGSAASESYWESFEQALETLQTLHFPLRSTEFLPNSPKRIGFLNCLERLLEAMVLSRSPLLLKVIIQMTAPDGEGHIAEAKIRNAVERFFADQSYELQCDRLQELWDLFANHAYAPTVRETILRRYLCTALWHCRYDTIVEFYKRIIRSISRFSSEDINGRAGWDLEHALVDLAGSFRLIEHYAALLPKSILTGENCPVAKELYSSPKDESVPVRGQRLIGDFSKRAHSVRKTVLLSNDRSAVELFRKYQCAAYRALVALISNTNEDARMYSVLLFRETREKGDYIWRHLIDCSNDELYLEGSQEQEETTRTVAKRVAIRQEGVDPAFRIPISKDPGLSVVRESSLSQQVFRFDMNHCVVLSAREVAEKDAAELAKRQKGTLTSVSLERTAINEHEVMATVCGCMRHMATSKVPLTAVVQFLASSLNDQGQPKNVRLFLAKVIDNCRKELQPHASLLLCPLMQLIVDGSTIRGLNPLVTDLIALILEWNRSSVSNEPKRQAAVGETGSLASVLLRFLMNHACQQQGARNTTAKVLRLNLDLIQELISQWHDVLIVPGELLYEMVSGNRQRLQTDERTKLQLIAGLQLGTIVLTKGRGRLVPWVESIKQEYLRSVLRCLDLPDSTSFKSAALLLGHSLAHLYPEGLPEDEDESVDELFHIECVTKLSAIQREYDRKFVDILYEIAKAFPSIADPFLSVISHRFPASAVPEKRMYLELLLGGRLEKFNDDLYRELASMELMLLLRDNELQLPTLHLLNRAIPLVHETQHLEQIVEPVGCVTTEPATRSECRAVAYEILIYIHEHNFAQLSEDCQQSVWRYVIRGLCGVQESDATETSTRVRILEYLTDSGKLPTDLRERFLFLLTELYDPTVETEFLGSAVALLLDPAIRCRESKDRLFLHEYLNADVKFNEYTIETATRQRHTMTLLTPMFADSSLQRQLQSFITGRGSQMEQLIRATQLSVMDRTTQQDENGHFEPTQDPTKFTKGRETFAMPTQHTLLFESSSLQLDRRSQRTGTETTQQETSFDRLRKRILRDSEANRQKQTTWAVSRHYSNQRQRSEQRRENASQVTLYRRYRLSDYPDLQINLLAFLLPLQALCRRDTACARQTFVAIFNGLVDCLMHGDDASRTVRMVGDEWDRFVGRLDESLHRILETNRTSDPNLFGGLIELTLGKASGKFTLSPRTIASVAGASNMLTMGALYLEAKLTDAADFDDEPVRTGGSITSEAEHWLQLSSLYHAMHEHSVMVGIFAEKLDSDPQLRKAIELEALGRYDRAHRAYCELVLRISQARVEERNFCYKSAFNCMLQLGQWDMLLDEIGNQLTNHEDLWTDDWNLENLLPNYVHGNVLLVLAGNETAREFYNMLQQWLHIPDRAKHIRQQFGEELTALYISGQEMVRARMFGEQTQRQFLDEWHCAGVLSGLVRTECLLSVRKVIELVAYSELLELEADKLEQATAGLITSWQNAQPALTDSLITWDTTLAYRRFLLEKLETKCDAAKERVSILNNVSKLSKQLYQLELELLEVAFEQNNIKYAGKIITSLRNSESCTGLREPAVEHVLRRKIARIRFERMRYVEASSDQIQTLLRGFRQLVKINDQTEVGENESGMAQVKRRTWSEMFQLAETVRTKIKSSNENFSTEDVTHIRNMIRVVMKLPEEEGDIERMALSERLRQLSMHCLQHSIIVLRPDSSRSSKERDSSDAVLVELADAHLRLARYCYQELNSELSEEEELPVERTLVTSLLPAIQYGSPEARHLFPVLLPLRNLQNNTLQREFYEHSSLVPSWNFLQWIPQLLSYMKITYDAAGSHQISNDRHFLDELLMRLVKEYPMALYHPARVILADIEGPVRPIVVQFRAALSFPVLDRFVDELCRVVMPETRLQSMLSELKSQLKSFTDSTAFQAYINRAIPYVFPTESNDLWRFGQAYRAALPLVDKFRALKLLHPVDDRTVILQKLEELGDELQSMRPRTKTKSMPLEDLSPWLAEFHCSSMRGQRNESSVEVPGQYGVDRETPNPSHHATIVKVMPDVLVFVTLRLPIQITFRGSDGRQYRFLAKFGEDLRQDQRIQQLQREITQRLRWDRHCREHQLALRTYEVVPIRPNFGLFGWLEGTIALSEIAKQAAPRYNPGDRGQAHVLNEYGRFLLSVSKQDTTGNESVNIGACNSPDLYGMAAAFGMPEQLRSKYVELSQTIRSSTLKRALYDMAASPESFYRLRMNFAKSLATMNITCWALGIGDRHLSNIVLERATGMLVGVDFGIAFSAGTRDLPIPELVPFRLTPQFVAVMEPMRLVGILQKCHLHTLQCLRDSRMLLRACLEVFVREPTVDWLRAARQRTVEKAGSERAPGGGRDWNPQVRVNTVLRKLSGANPKKLLAEELRFGVIAQKREFLVGYLALVNASAPVSTEKVGRETVLSTALQTEMLLEMAVDSKLLGITFAGWYPWF